MRAVLWKLILCCGIGLILAPLVLSYPSGPWPQRKILLYDNHTGALDMIAQAANNWNDARVGITFAITRHRADADVVISVFRSSKQMADFCRPLQSIIHMPAEQHISACVDWQGYKPVGQVRMGILTNDRTDTSGVSHELGHVLGLYHNTNPCSIMSVNPNAGGLLCKPDRRRTTQIEFSKGCQQQTRQAALLHCQFAIHQMQLCGPGTVDVAAARLLYGGPGNRRWSPYCPTRAITARYPHGLAATVKKSERVNIRWQRQYLAWARSRQYPLTSFCGNAAKPQGGIATLVYYQTLPALRQACGAQTFYAVPRSWIDGEAYRQLPRPGHRRVADPWNSPKGDRLYVWPAMRIIKRLG